jgi:NAD(P)-dependent dehydrogenase (short-subunit alcohol dehydrogenase family)
MPATLRLAGKTALVTGASRGIGKAIATRLAADGALVAVHYGRNKAHADAVVAAIAAAGGRAFAVGADLSPGRVVASAKALVDAVERELVARTGKADLHVLVNNAGVAPVGDVTNTTEALFDEVFAVNVKAPLFITQNALRLIPAGGRIINLSSGLSRFAYPPVSTYALTKGAVDVLSLNLAKQLAPRGITVNSLAPGIIDTDMNADMLADAGHAKFAASVSAFNRVGKPEDIADVAAFLASDDSRWVTGQVIDATGGSLIGMG